MIKTVTRTVSLIIIFGLLFWAFYPASQAKIKPPTLSKNSIAVEKIDDSTQIDYYSDQEQSIVYRIVRVNSIPVSLQVCPVTFVKDSIYKRVSMKHVFNPQKLNYPIHITLEAL